MNKTNVPVHAKDGEVWEGVAQKNVFLKMISLKIDNK